MTYDRFVLIVIWWLGYLMQQATALSQWVDELVLRVYFTVFVNLSMCLLLSFQCNTNSTHIFGFSLYHAVPLWTDALQFVRMHFRLFPVSDMLFCAKPIPGIRAFENSAWNTSPRMICSNSLASCITSYLQSWRIWERLQIPGPMWMAIVVFFFRLVNFCGYEKWKGSMIDSFVCVWPPLVSFRFPCSRPEYSVTTQWVLCFTVRSWLFCCRHFV